MKNIQKTIDALTVRLDALAKKEKAGTADAYDIYVRNNAYNQRAILQAILEKHLINH